MRSKKRNKKYYEEIVESAAEIFSKLLISQIEFNKNNHKKYGRANKQANG
jgi:hypothetical protein